MLLPLGLGFRVGSVTCTETAFPHAAQQLSILRADTRLVKRRKYNVGKYNTPRNIVCHLTRHIKKKKKKKKKHSCSLTLIMRTESSPAFMPAKCQTQHPQHFGILDFWGLGFRVWGLGCRSTASVDVSMWEVLFGPSFLRELLRLRLGVLEAPFLR